MELASGMTAVTREIGPNGLYFDMPAGHRLDDWVRVELELASAGLRMSALGEVLRIDRGVRTDGVAMRLHSKQLRPRD